MIHRLLKRGRQTIVAKQAPKQEFSLGFSANQSIENTLEQILQEVSEVQSEESDSNEELLTLRPIPNDSGFETPDLTPPPSVFTKKTISKNKTFKGLNSPLKVPPYLQKNNSPAFSAVPKPTTIASAPIKPTPHSTSFRLPLQSPHPSIQATRLSIGKELLKSAASCQMISIQEAHSMGSKISLPPAGLIIPTLAELLHRNADSVQKNLLLKMSKTNVPFDYFKSLIGNQSVQKYHSLLVPYQIIPLFYRGNSLTVLAEHPFVLSLAETILNANQCSVPWIHFIPASIDELMALT